MLAGKGFGGNEGILGITRELLDVMYWGSQPSACSGVFWVMIPRDWSCYTPNYARYT